MATLSRTFRSASIANQTCSSVLAAVTVKRSAPPSMGTAGNRAGVIRMGQGYYFSRALPAYEASALLLVPSGHHAKGRR
jgi:hypothetical protein